MTVKLGAALSLQVQYLQLRGIVYQFRIRVPLHLVHHYGKPDIRKSLGTSDCKGQFATNGANEMSFADQFYALAGQVRPV